LLHKGISASETVQNSIHPWRSRVDIRISFGRENPLLAAVVFCRSGSPDRSPSFPVSPSTGSR